MLYTKSQSNKVLIISILLTCTVLPSLFSQTFNEIIKGVASDSEAYSQFGYSVATSGDYSVIGAPYESYDVNGDNYKSKAGSSYIFKRDEFGDWIEMQKIVAFDRSSNSYFGTSVAISGDHLVVGAKRASNNYTGSSNLLTTGASYIFEKDISGNWVHKQKIVGKGSDAGDEFGTSVAIDDNYLLVGAILNEDDDDGTPKVYSGSGYIFEREQSGTWVEKTILKSFEKEGYSYFGKTLAISGDYAVIGFERSRWDADGQNQMQASGAVCIYKRDNFGNWNETQKIVASDRESGDEFGESVSISGNYIIVGTTEKDYVDQNGTKFYEAGAAYIFECNELDVWVEVKKIISPNVYNKGLFGSSVAVSGDYVIVGATRELFPTISGKNFLEAVYVYKRSNDGIWNDLQSLRGSDQTVKRFGHSIAISNETIIVGRDNYGEYGLDPINDSESIHIFEFGAQNQSPYIENSFDDIVLDEDFNTFTLDFNSIFEDLENSDSHLDILVDNHSIVNVSIDAGLATITSILDTSGIDTLVFTAFDLGGLFISDTLILTVNPVNDTPMVKTSINEVQVDEGFNSFTINLFETFDDIEDTDSDLSFVVSNSNLASVSIQNGIATIASKMDINGIDTIKFTAIDLGGLSISAELLITVNDQIETLIESPINLGTLIYPTLVKNKIQIESIENIQSVIICTLDGTVLFTTNKTDISVVSLPTGVYILKILFNNTILTHKFVKE